MGGVVEGEEVGGGERTNEDMWRGREKKAVGGGGEGKTGGRECEANR